MNSQVIDNIRTISGLFREAILTNVAVQVGENDVAKIYSVEESDRRALTEIRSLVIMPGFATIKVGDKVCLRLRYPDFLVECEVKCLNSGPDSFATTMPTSVELCDHRSTKRFLTADLNLPPTTALLTGNGRHYEVDFRLINISRFGYAGEIETDARDIFEPGFRIGGKSVLHSGQIDLDGIVVNLRQTQRAADRKRLSIRVLRDDHISKAQNIANHQDYETSHKESYSEGSNCNFTIVVKSPLNAHLTVELDVFRVSVSSFTAKFVRAEMQHYIVPGLPLILNGTSLVAEVLHSEFGRVSAQWVSGSEYDRVNWLKKISSYLAMGVSTSVSDAGDLLAIFCQSGAFSSEFLRSQRHKFNSIVKNIESESSNSSYVHRWVDRSGDHQAIGHISCIRVGDNAWFATDLVKSAKDDRPRSDFVKKFFLSFSQFACTLQPVPRVLLIWLEGHPFWRNLESRLGEKCQPLAVKVKMGYLRLGSKSIDESATARVTISEVRGVDYQKIEQLQSEIGDADVLAFARAFDFCIDQLSSEKLARSIQQDGKIFWRRYFEVNSAQGSGLAIITSAPDGMNPNRVVDGVWFFEFKNRPVHTDTHWLDICAALRELSARMGISLSGIRRVNPSIGFSKLPIEDAEMVGYLVHPSLLQMFG